MAINVEKFADEVDAKIGAEEAQLVRDLQFKLETSQVALKGAEERAKMLLDAKNHWAERARTAESRLGECLDVLRPIALALDQGHPIEPGSFSHD